MPGPKRPVPPEHASKRLDHAKALHSSARLSEAETAYREVLVREPSNFDAIHNLGILLLQTGRAELAVTQLKHAVVLNKHHVHANANLGTAYLLLNRLEEALDIYNRVVEMDARLAGAWRNRGTILQGLGRHDAAAESFHRCLDLVPDFPFALGSMFEARRYACDWRDHQKNAAAIVDALAAGRNVDRPFSFLSVSGSAAEQLRCAALHASYLCPQAPRPEWRGEQYVHPKIRVAYVSADYRAHVVMHLMAPILEAHDVERFHTIGVSLVAGDDSKILGRAKKALSQFIDVSALSDAEAARAIRALEADIVVDLTGYTTGCRAAIFAHRTAPVQVSYLGYAGTSGSAHFDYLIADRISIPDALERFFTERIVRLPHCFLPLGDPEPMDGPMPTRRNLGLPEAAFVLCAFNNAYKFNPTIFEIWMRLLREITHSVLWLREGGAGMRRNLQREAAARGVDPTRLIFAPKLPAVSDHLRRQRQADLFLDTWPYGAHATARDALCAGLPVLTCLGESMASRVAGSLSTTLGLPGLVTDNLHDYEARAIELARDPALLASLRSALDSTMRDRSRFMGARYCAHLEAAYERMREQTRLGLSPVSFEVAAIAGSSAEIGGAGARGR